MTEDKKPQDAQKVQEVQKAQEPKPARKARKKPAAAAAQKEQKATKRSRARKAKEEPHEPGRELTRGEQLLIIAAANKSGRDAAKVELPEALAIMEIEPADSSEAGIAAAVDQYWQNISIGQMEEMLKTSGNDGKLFKGYLLAYLGEAADTAETPAESLLNHIAEISARDATLQTSFAGIYVEAQEMLHRIADALQTAAKSTDLAAEARESIAKLTQEVQETLQAASKVDVVGQLHNLFQNLQLFGEITGRVDLKQLQSNLEAAQALFPYFEKAFKEAKAADPEKYAGITAKQIFDLLTLDGAEAPEEFAPLIERAWQLKTEQDRNKDLLRVFSSQIEILDYPLDKPNNLIWSMLTRATDPRIHDGQSTFDIDVITSGKGRKSEAVVYVAINFGDLGPDVTITRQLTSYDKRVYIAAAALFNGGNNVVSASQIYRRMGNTQRPSQDDITKINESLTKMGAARLLIDNSGEIKVNKGYAAFKYDASLLPFERIRAYINNVFCDDAIHFFREPPLISFARQRGQITGISQKLLESPVSKTDANLQLDDYLLERIGHMKNPKSHTPRKMLFSTIFDRCNITSRSQKSRAPEKIKRYLDHYQKCGWIKGYEMSADSVIILI